MPVGLGRDKRSCDKRETIEKNKRPDTKLRNRSMDVKNYKLHFKILSAIIHALTGIKLSAGNIV